MANSLEQVTANAKALSSKEREQLIASLLEDDEMPFSEEWAAELKHRSQEVANGAQTYSLEEVLQELCAEFHQQSKSS